MTAHDPRVTLTEAEVDRLVFEFGDHTNIYALTDTVADLIAARLAPIRELADLLIEQGDEHVNGCVGQADCAACVHHDLMQALDAQQDAPRGPVGGEQDHDGGEGQGDAASELRRLHRIGTTPVGEVPPGDAAFYESHPLRDMTGGYARDFRLMVAEWLETR